MDAHEFVQKVAAKLTGNPVRVKLREDEYGAVMEVFSTNNAPLFGKRGATIEAIRVVAKALGYNGKHRIRIILREPEHASTKKT